MATNEVPPWGAPDGGAPEPGSSGSGTSEPGPSGYGTPGPSGYGTPGPSESTAPGGVPDYGTPPPTADRFAADELRSRGSSSTGTSLLTAPTVVVVEESGFLTIGGYWLTTPDEERLGSLRREATAAGFLFGGAAKTTYRLLDARDQPIGAMERPGTLGGRSRFVVTDASGAQIGTIDQESSFGAPTLLLTSADGLMTRLTGGKYGRREWQLVDGLDPGVLMGQVSQEYNGLRGMINDSHRFAVQLSPQLDGDHRLLAVMATICLDYIRDAKKHR